MATNFYSGSFDDVLTMLSEARTNQIDWVELIETDPARAFQLRERSGKLEKGINDLVGMFIELDEQYHSLQEENKVLGQNNDALRGHVQFLEDKCEQLEDRLSVAEERAGRASK